MRVGDAARFHASRDAASPLTGRVIGIDQARTLYLPNPMLSTEHGGQIPSHTVRAGQIMPRDVLYRVQIALDAPARALRTRVGEASIDVQSRGRLPQWVKDLIVVAIRETGF